MNNIAHAEACPAGPSDKGKGKGGREAFAASALALGGSFVNFVTFNDYPLFRGEVAIVLVSLLGIAAVFALLHRRVGGMGKALLDGLLIYIAVDLNSDLTWLGIGLGGIAALLRLSRNISLLMPLSIISGAVLASAVLGLSERRPPIWTTLEKQPAPTRSDSVLHILLDEHGGSGGAEPALRQELVQTYVGQGFRLFDKGYSRHFHTVNAVPDALNFGSPGTSKNVDQTLDVGRTDLLTLLEKRGYRLNIYQSDFADFCRYQSEASCTNYWSPSLAFIADKNIAAPEKARLMAYKFANLSDFITNTATIASYWIIRSGLRDYGVPTFPVDMGARSSGTSGIAILDRMTSDLAKAQPGNAYFAHVLAPHYPYVVDANCTTLPPTQWGYRRSSREMAERRAAYGAQASCVTKKIRAIVSAYLASSAGRNAAIIVHGDHGNRITSVEPADWNRGRISNDDYMAGFSTILAVRAAGVEAGLDPQPAAVPDVLKTLADNQFKSLAGLSQGNEDVHLDGPNWTVGSTTSIKGTWPARN